MKDSLKMNIKRVRVVLPSILALGLLAGCTISVEPRGAVVAPAPVVEVQLVPESYVWDGTEYVGFVGGHYMYLGPGEVWLVCEPFRLERFHGWERGHPDWRRTAIRNEHFRKDRDGRIQPRSVERPNTAQQKVAPNTRPQKVTPNKKEEEKR